MKENEKVEGIVDKGESVGEGKDTDEPISSSPIV